MRRFFSYIALTIVLVMAVGCAGVEVNKDGSRSDLVGIWEARDHITTALILREADGTYTERACLGGLDPKKPPVHATIRGTWKLEGREFVERITAISIDVPPSWLRERRVKIVSITPTRFVHYYTDSEVFAMREVKLGGPSEEDFRRLKLRPFNPDEPWYAPPPG